MNEKEYQLISNALKSPDAASAVKKTCRKILIDRLQWESQPDRELRFLLSDIANHLQFGIETKLESISESGLVKQPYNPTQAVLVVLLFIVGLFLVALESTFVSVLGGLMAGVGGFLLGQQLSKKKSTKVISRLVVTTTAQELGEEIDAIYTAFSAFYNYRQLEGRQKDVLLWFQQLYRKSDNDELRESISDLLGQYGYSFETFSDERATDFELHGGRVENTKTTIPAIINDKGTLICKGVAVIPQ